MICLMAIIIGSVYFIKKNRNIGAKAMFQELNWNQKL